MTEPLNLVDTLINIAYIVSAIFFIFGIRMMGKAESAQRGNLTSSVGMLIAVVATLARIQTFDSWMWVVAGIAIGGGIGYYAAQQVEMTGMPELVALFNGFGGLASLMVGWAEYQSAFAQNLPLDGFTTAVVILTVLIGGITFTGSVYAWGKLSGRVSGSPITFVGQHPINGVIAAAVVGLGIYLILQPSLYLVFVAAVALSLVLGVTGVMPIGGGDMPVVVSLLNSFSGLAAAAAGFVIQNNVLVVAGCLVGASGLILTIIMCKAMNRTLWSVLFSGFGGAAKGGRVIEGEMKAASIEDAYYVLEAAQNVIFVPGYGMAVAQAQHVVKELGQLLEDNGAEVRFVVHPVAGRMPGHMNVLLAEADVQYEQLVEMEDVNPGMEQVDVAIIVGANDVVNPAALTDEGSPIYGMPIIEAHNARTVYALKRGRGRGFSGIVNELFLANNTRMLFGDAKQTISDLIAQFKE